MERIQLLDRAFHARVSADAGLTIDRDLGEIGNDVAVTIVRLVHTTLYALSVKSLLFALNGQHRRSVGVIAIMHRTP